MHWAAINEIQLPQKALYTISCLTKALTPHLQPWPKKAPRDWEQFGVRKTIWIHPLARSGICFCIKIGNTFKKSYRNYVLVHPAAQDIKYDLNTYNVHQWLEDFVSKKLNIELNYPV